MQIGFIGLGINAPAGRVREESVVSTPAPGAASADRIRHVKLSTLTLPLDTPISDAKVLTGRQKPMTEIVFLFAEITTEDGHERDRIQLLQARRRTRPVRPRQGDRRRADRRGPQRHRPGLREAAAGPAPPSAAAAWPPRPSRRSTSPCTTSRPSGPTCPLAKLLGRVPRLGAHLQHLRRLPARPDRGGEGAGQPVAGRRHRRDQDQGRPSRQPDRPGPGHRGPRAPRRRRAAHGRRQPAVGPAHRDAHRSRSSRSSTWSGSRNRWTRTTPKATPSSPGPWTPPIATGEMLSSVAEHIA